MKARVVLSLLAFAVVLGAVALFAKSRKVVTYRFDSLTLPEAPDETPALEARIETQRTPFELAEVAQAYVRRARKTGDPIWLSRAEALAKESLHILSSPNSGAKLAMASVADARHQFDEAIRWGTQAFADKQNASAAQSLAGSTLARGDLDAAAHYAELAVRLRGETDSYLWRALALSARGRDKEAEADFQRAVQFETAGLRETSSRVRALWARHLLRRGKNLEAGRLAEKAARIAPDSGFAWGIRGEIAFARGYGDTAAEHFQKAFRLSREPRYVLWQAKALRLDERPADAKRALTEAESLLRRTLQTETGHRLDLAECLLERGDRPGAEEARGLLEAELKVRRSPDVYFALARASEAAGNAEAATVFVQQALAAGALDRRYVDLAARLEAKVGNHSRAQLYKNLGSG